MTAKTLKLSTWNIYKISATVLMAPALLFNKKTPIKGRFNIMEQHTDILSLKIPEKLPLDKINSNQFDTTI